jgi:beta-mannosidase
VVYSQNTEITLNTPWQFKQKGKDSWFPAKVPGNVHMDLLQNKQIPDPFFGDNEKKVQWVENEDWEYNTTFYCDTKTILKHNIELKFEGLDTYAKVFLNGKLILESDNMFRSWTVNVKKLIKEGENSLLIIFESAVKKGKAEAATYPYTLPGEEKVFARKAQYQYGWDWGPRLVTCGIWKPIKLIAWNQVKIESVYACTKEIKDSIAKVDLIFELNCAEEGYYEIRYNIGSDGKQRQQFRTQTQLVALKPGLSTTTLSTLIDHPRLWWCNGFDKRRPNIYTAGIKMTHGDTLITQQALQFGVRTIELIQDKDPTGSSFCFKLNGVPVFMKGANYIPHHSFLPNAEKDASRKLIRIAKESNMNMLRVWGGGVYADEEFYKDCDRAGILIWQDFMFACAMYPGNSKFVENVGYEIKEQIKNLRNHPCLALWCGNNEIDEGWKNWGWQKQFKYSFNDSTKIYDNYVLLFEHLIPDILKANSFEAKNYIPSSPSIGWGHKESLQQGDSHYWGVWWGNEPFENYEKKVGRFMSEYGFQSMPSLETFKSFCDSADLNMNSASVKNHQKHPAGYKIIADYMSKDYTVPKKFEDLIYVSQLVQERGMRMAIEAHRRAKPYCMGTLFWQLNDCWPVTSWSAIDFYNRPKAFYYSLPELYDNILVSIKKENENHKIFIVNDKTSSFEGKITISIKNFSGKEIFSRTVEANIPANSSSFYLTLSEKEIPGLEKDKVYLSCQLTSSDETIKKKTFYFFVSPKDLKLSIPKLEIKYNSVFYGVTIKSDTFVKNIYLDQGNNSFSKNYFDLEPGEEIEVRMTKPIQNTDQIKILSINHLNQ